MSTAVTLDKIVKRFGTFTAVHPLDLEIEQGSFLTLLGPSGCGKTTTLRMIAGLLDPTEGDILVKGQRVNTVPIHKRNLGIVFQSYALFPHKTIFENVAFGLKYRNVPKAQVEEKVKAAMELVQLPHMGDRYPSQLSGGQQQRIALARAIVIEPDVLLLDEPLSALDANLREDMRVELKNIQEKLGVTTVFVTHDQGEALAMSDNIVVMRDGRIEQVGSPWEVYNRPASEFEAQFLGASNLLDVSTEGAGADKVAVELPQFGKFEVDTTQVPKGSASQKGKLVLRAEKLQLSPQSTTPQAGEVSAVGAVEAVDYLGQSVRYFVQVGDQKLQAINTVGQALFNQGDAVQVHFDPQNCTLLGD
ncbi:ABC transporter ATP-binding protein [Maritalea sp. S77]|uniref:ABC transporter ATP-binding protein n=1 Tax=Maritalea sp. S77 TaxID=3415125 RepID=UPI003C7A260D